ncbi:MAG: glutathione S-transferase family protein [Cyanobacteria bacterium]|nr:glutathione S-transferase family protein [Cyanobacteriota bacterium]
MGSLRVEPLSWKDLQGLAPGRPDLVNGPTNPQARLRLFGQDEAAVRVTLYRDHHAWCPYCQKVWLWLEEKRVPYRIRKVTMLCYGDKESWYRRLVPSGYLPALELDGRLITESDRILEALEGAFGPLGAPMGEPHGLTLRRLERRLFASWCEWLCRHGGTTGQEERAAQAFKAMAGRLEEALAETAGPFLLGEAPGTADLVFVPYLERMNASLAYYKGYRLRQAHPLIDHWFRALEQRSTYLGTQSDFHTHAHDLPPQMGCCQANGSSDQRALAQRIDAGPWPISDGGEPDPETSRPESPEAPLRALERVCHHHPILLQRNPLGAAGFDQPLRAALTLLATGEACRPQGGSAQGLRYLRDRISVPRDMPLDAARCLRRALEATAKLDPRDAGAQGPPLTLNHRLDQDPTPFLHQNRGDSLV